MTRCRVRGCELRDLKNGYLLKKMFGKKISRSEFLRIGIFSTLQKSQLVIPPKPPGQVYWTTPKKKIAYLFRMIPETL